MVWGTPIIHITSEVHGHWRLVLFPVAVRKYPGKSIKEERVYWTNSRPLSVWQGHQSSRSLKQLLTSQTVKSNGLMHTCFFAHHLLFNQSGTQLIQGCCLHLGRAIPPQLTQLKSPTVIPKGHSNPGDAMCQVDNQNWTSCSATQALQCHPGYVKSSLTNFLRLSQLQFLPRLPCQFLFCG